MLRFLPVASSAIYGIALATLAIAGLWTAFVVVACVCAITQPGGPQSAAGRSPAIRTSGAGPAQAIAR